MKCRDIGQRFCLFFICFIFFIDSRCVYTEFEEKAFTMLNEKHILNHTSYIRRSFYNPDLFECAPETVEFSKPISYGCNICLMPNVFTSCVAVN